jgi:uncharacterized protein YjbI with pentapeptide repeats
VAYSGFWKDLGKQGDKFRKRSKVVLKHSHMFGPNILILCELSGVDIRDSVLTKNNFSPTNLQTAKLQSNYLVAAMRS